MDTVGRCRRHNCARRERQTPRVTEPFDVLNPRGHHTAGVVIDCEADLSVSTRALTLGLQRVGRPGHPMQRLRPRGRRQRQDAETRKRGDHHPHRSPRTHPPHDVPRSPAETSAKPVSYEAYLTSAPESSRPRLRRNRQTDRQLQVAGRSLTRHAAVRQLAPPAQAGLSWRCHGSVVVTVLLKMFASSAKASWAGSGRQPRRRANGSRANWWTKIPEARS